MVLTLPGAGTLAGLGSLQFAEVVLRSVSDPLFFKLCAFAS